MNKIGKQLINPERDRFEGEPKPGLYVHWPYCVSKCPYCDFNSHVKRVFSEDEYVEAICSELDHMAELNDETRLASVFFGGGTPSLMRPESVGAILDHIGKRFTVTPDLEVTLEANPSSVEAQRFHDLGLLGVNRVSLGVQALDLEALQVLGRAHSVGEALEAVELARSSFPRMSFDLIYGRHGQELAAWREELKRALDLSNGHLSLYQLTIEEGTQYKNLYDRGELNLPSSERAARFFHETRAICEKAGLSAYEISNFAAPGEQSRHNLVYWRYGSYMGVGPGAHGRIVHNGRRLASAAIRSPGRWLAQVRERGHGVETLIPLKKSEQADEMLLMGMRLMQGLDLARLKQVSGYTINPQTILDLQEAGLCAPISDGQYLSASDKGIGVLNQIVEQLSSNLEAVIG